MIEVDEDMAPVVQQLWVMGFKTEGCCQDFGESIERNEHRSDTSEADRKRHADFHHGMAWLKLPEADAVRLIVAAVLLTGCLQHWGGSLQAGGAAVPAFEVRYPRSARALRPRHDSRRMRCARPMSGTGR
jgi:hypothetical protein